MSVRLPSPAENSISRKLKRKADKRLTFKRHSIVDLQLKTQLLFATVRTCPSTQQFQVLLPAWVTIEDFSSSTTHNSPMMHSRIPFNIFVVTYLFREDGDILVEGFWWTDVAPRDAWFSRCTRGQFTFFKYKGQKGKQRVPVTNKQITFDI